MKSYEAALALRFMAFLLAEGCELPKHELVGLDFKVLDGVWYAHLTAGSPFGLTNHVYQFDFKRWVAYQSGG